MKLIRKILRYLYLHLTPKGRQELYWNNAGLQLENALLEKGKTEIEVKQKCVKTAEKIIKKKRPSKFFRTKFSKYKLSKLVNEKHKEELKDVRVKIDQNLNFKDVKI